MREREKERELSWIVWVCVRGKVVLDVVFQFSFMIFSFVLCRTGCCLLNIISEIDTGDFCYKVLTLMLKFARVFHLKVNFKSICNKNVQCSLICSCFSSQFSQSVHRMVRAVLCEFVSLEQYFFYTILYIFVWFALRYMYMYMC